MAKIFSVLTLLIALGATFLGFQSKDLVEKLQTAAAKDHQDLLDTRTKLKKTEDKLKETEDELASTKSELEKTKETLRATEDELAKTKTELQTTATKLADVEKSLADVQTQLKEAMGGVGSLATLKADMEALTTQKAELETKNKELEIVKAELTTKVETLTARNKELDDKVASQGTVIDRYQKNIMQKGIRGQVTAVNSGWGFCVLSIGDRQGAAANKIMIVTRGGQAIGKVKIINVEASQSVADILPGTFTRGTYIQPGDGVIYTGDDKVRVEEVASSSTPGVNPPTVPLPELPLP
jgi:myosin heavy subunit